MVNGKNKFLLSLLLGIFLILSFSIISASSNMSINNITVVTPGVSGILTGGSAVFNCSIQSTTYSGENWTRVRTWLKSTSLSANTTNILVSDWILNTTTQDLNGTLNSTWVEDANDYTFTCQLWNGTEYRNQTRSSITINNTVPTAPSSLLPTSDSDGTVNFSATVTNSNTVSCVLHFVGTSYNGPTQTMSYSGNSCNLQLTNVPEQSYTWYVTASDGSDNTNSATQTTNIDLKSSVGKAGAITESEQENIIPTFSLGGEGTSNIPIGWIILGLSLVAVIGVFIFVFKKR
jgi:hypothetical protein